MPSKVFFYQNNPCIIVRDINDEFAEVSVNHKYLQDMSLTGHCQGCLIGDSDNKLQCTCEEVSWVIEAAQEEDHKMIVVVEKRLLHDLPIEQIQIQALIKEIEKERNRFNETKERHQEWAQSLVMTKKQKLSLEKEIEFLEAKKEELLKAKEVYETSFSKIQSKYQSMIVEIDKYSSRNMQITRKEYDSLLASEKKLDALESGGVDNWQWYDESLKNAGL